MATAKESAAAKSAEPKEQSGGAQSGPDEFTQGMIDMYGEVDKESKKDAEGTDAEKTSK